MQSSISYVGVDRCVDSASAGKPRGFNYVCMTAVPFFLRGKGGRAVAGAGLVRAGGRRRLRRRE